jgi:hypothetical protein
MKKRAELIAFWLKSAESDLKVATHLLKKKTTITVFLLVIWHSKKH